MSGREPERLPPDQAGALYLDYGEPLLAFAYGVLRNRELAREVVQATFGKALEGAGHVPPEARKAWLYRVAYHEALVLRRRQGVADRVHERLAIALKPAAETPEDEFVRWEQVRRVREALGQLPDSLREVVRLRIYDELTFEEIARRLNIPLGTALTRMRSAIQRLERALGSPE